MFNISSEPGATPNEIAVVREGLHRFNFDATGLTQHHEMTLFVRDGVGAIRGGLLGYVWGEWLHYTEIKLAEDCRQSGQLLQRLGSLFGGLVAF
jgi:hypothetical protein